MNLQELIEREGKKNNELKRTLDEEGYLPNEQLINAMDVSDLYTLSRESVDFRFGIQLEILMSDHRLVGLMESYLADYNAFQERQKVDAESLQKIISQYQTEIKMLKKQLKTQYMAGYDARW